MIFFKKGSIEWQRPTHCKYLILVILSDQWLNATGLTSLVSNTSRSYANRSHANHSRLKIIFVEDWSFIYTNFLIIPNHILPISLRGKGVTKIRQPWEHFTIELRRDVVVLYIIVTGVVDTISMFRCCQIYILSMPALTLSHLKRPKAAKDPGICPACGVIKRWHLCSNCEAEQDLSNDT